MWKAFLIGSALLVTAALSGCAGKGDEGAAKAEDPAPTAPPAPQFMPMPMDVHDCSFIMAVVPVETSKVAPFLPEGFTPISAMDLGIPAPEDFAQGKGALLGLEAELCGKLREGDGYKAGSTGSYWIPVQPPAHKRLPGVEFSVVKLDMMAWSPQGADMLKHAGLFGQTGSVSFSEPVPTKGLPATPADSELFGMNGYSAQMKFDGGETIQYQAGGSLTKYFIASPFQNFTCHGYFPVNGDPKQGVIEGQADFSATVIHESMGVLNVVGSGTASKLIGAGEHDYYALVGYGSYWFQELWLPAPQAGETGNETMDAGH